MACFTQSLSSTSQIKISMENLWTFAIIVIFAGRITALPSFSTCANRYPRAKHSVPLYRSAPPALGNFEADITVGTQNVRAILDTGSSNTWFMQQGVQCLDPATFEPISNDLCGFTGPRLMPSSSFEQVDTHSNLTYGSGQSIIAVDGYDHILFGGIEIPKQEINLATMVVGKFTENVTGLVGLAYPFLTKAYPGNNPSADVACNDTVGASNTSCNEQHYSPLLSTIFAKGLTPPLFAFAISRSAPKAGVMTVGGLPDLHEPSINVTSQSVEAIVPIEKYDGLQHYSWFVITVDSLNYPGAAAGAGKGQWVVDSGTIQTLVGKEQARYINTLFNPPAQYNETLGLYLVECNATAPDFGVEIGGKFFNFNSKDMILSGQGDTVCESAIQPSTTAGSYPPILGSTFFRNVLAVFDVGESQMTFASRVHYQE